jgi:uncharacterized membrane protein YjgN (DUF898 family)
MAEHLSLLAQGSLGDFCAGEREKSTSTGEEISEMFDIDVGI